MIEPSVGWFSLIVLAGFLFDWFAVLFRLEKIKPLSKTLAMVLVILWTFSAAGWQADPLVVLILFAQAFGLAGDVLLLIDERWFVWGLGAFLVGHLFYISVLGIKFNQLINQSSFVDGFPWWIFLCLLGWGVVLATFYLIVRQIMINQHIKQALWRAIQVYAWILSGMVACSFLLVIIFPGFSWVQLLLPIGSVLFLVSDSLLTYHRFIYRFRQGQLFVRITYHLAQFCLAWGFLAIISH